MKKKASLLAVIVLAVTLLLTLFGGCNMKDEFDENVMEVDLCESAVRQYLSATTSKEQFSILCQYLGQKFDGPSIVTVRVGKGTAPYKFVYATNKSLENAKEIETSGRNVSLSGLVPGTTYYYKAYDNDGNQVSCGTIVTLDAPVRCLKISGTKNVRDIGGWTTESGAKVNYCLLYRGAQLNGYNNGPRLDSKGIAYMRDDLGIKTEIDLRKSGVDDADQTTCAFAVDGDRVYVKANISQYDKIFGNEATEESLREIFAVLADKSNYPIYFHCNAGADRTGTLAFLMNGLLGVSYEDLTRDFELTSFGGLKSDARWRSKANALDTNFDSTGIYQDDADNYIAWGKLYTQIMNKYSQSNKLTLQQTIEKYLLKIGVTAQQIDNFKQIMLSEN